MHPEKVKSFVATLGMEHMGGKQTIETGAGGNTYAYSGETPENGGVITSLIDVYNNNIWLVEAIARAATDNKWPRVDVKSGISSGPGVNGGFQGAVKSPMNRGRDFRIPGIGLAGDWPGGWTQTFAQVDTEAGPHGFDENYFVQQVAGLTQLTGEFMLVKPMTIDLGWGAIKTALNTLPDSDFAAAAKAAADRKALMAQYVEAFRHVEVSKHAEARASLKALTASISSTLVPEKQAGVKKLVDDQLAKLS